MANMSYCKFENTYSDLNDCYRSINEDVDDLSESEAYYRKKLLELCQKMLDEVEEN